MQSSAEAHRQQIIEQFTRQSVPFAEMPAHNDAAANRLVLETLAIDADDDVLDVACGPGLITCAVAQVARSVTGVDITPAMLATAQARPEAQALKNIAWQLADAAALPFADGSFSVVMTRYSVHHMPEPQTTVSEMARVCRPGGRVAVIDVCMSSPEQGALYDAMERLRDPSHVRALSLAELGELFSAVGLRPLNRAFYKLDVDVEELLGATRTSLPEADAVRRMLENDLSLDRLGVGAYREEDKLRFAFPIMIVVGQKPAAG